MKEPETRTGTKVYYGQVSEMEEVKLERFKFELREDFAQKPFEIHHDWTNEEVSHYLDTEIERLKKEKLEKREPQRQLIDDTSDGLNTKLEYKDRVNIKRERIQEQLDLQEKPNIKKVAETTGSSFAIVKRIYNEMRLLGGFKRFDYCKKHSEREKEALDNSIEGIETRFTTVTDIKRANPSYSRKTILKRLHERGLLWKRVPKVKRKDRQKQPNSSYICTVIRSLCAGFPHDDVVILYTDEMKLPLYQSSTHHWAIKGQEDNMRYSRRPITSLVTAMALCSLERFVSVQLMTDQVSTVDFAYFLEKSIEQLPTNKRYFILLDNATWHKGEFIKRSKIVNFLLFNEPHQFRLNLIENAFSYVRSAFRRRPQQETVEGELRTIINIFFEPLLEKKFKGFHRNHIRQLKIMLEKHSAKDDK